MANDEASIESRYSWWIAVIGLTIGALSFGAVTSVPILLKPLSRHWETGASSVALVHTSAMFGAAVGGLVLGRVLDRVGFFRIALVGAAATGIGLLLASFATELAVLHWIYGVLIGGVGQGAFFSPLTAAVSQWFDRHRAIAIALVACGQSVGGLVLPPLMRWGVDAIGWRAMLMSYGVVAGFALMASSFAFRRKPPMHVLLANNLRAAEIDRSPSRACFLVLGLCMTLSNHASFIVIAHLTAFGEEQGLAPAAAAGLVSTLLGVSLFSRLTVGQMSRRWGCFNVLLAMSTLLAVGAVCLVSAQGTMAIWIAVIPIGLAFGGYLPGYAILVRELFPAAQAGRRIAEIFFFAFVAAGIGSLTGGWIRDLTGSYVVPFWFGAGSAISGAVMLLLLYRQLRHI